MVHGEVVGLMNGELVMAGIYLKEIVKIEWLTGTSRGGGESNSPPSRHESSLLATRLPRHSTRPTQPPTLSGTGNEYQPKCGDAVRLGSKGRYGSFHLWINVWVAGKTV